MKLYQFPESRLPGAYYLGKLPQANRQPNPPQFRNARIHVIRAIEYACYAVFRRLGKSDCPLVVYDCADANGRTPAGRHPAGAHDAATANVSGNCDLGYFLRQWRGSEIPGPSANNHLTGPPDNLDLEREAWWHYYLGKLDATFGGSPLIRLSAVDPMAEKPIDGAIATLQQDQAAMREAVRICYSNRDPRAGWAGFHHNHRHIRFGALNNDEEIGKYIEERFIAPLLLETPKPDIPPIDPNVPEAPGHDAESPAAAAELEDRIKELEARIKELEAQSGASVAPGG